MAGESGARASQSLAGELRDRPLAVLLAAARERGASGTFTFCHGDRREIVTMREGDIANVRTSTPVAYLGGILHEMGCIDTRTLDESLLEVARSRRLHGEVLLERGAINHAQLDDSLVEQTLRRVQEVFSLPEDATWSFSEDIDELAGARDEQRPAVDTWPAIWRGLRAHAPASHARRTIAKVEGEIHLRDLRLVQRFALATDEMALCERLHAQATSVGRLVASSPLARERTELLIYLLALSRCIVRVDTQLIGPADLGIEGVRERAARIDGEAPFVALGLQAGASVEAARAAFFRLARLWHPDKLPPSLAEVRAECQHVFVKLSEAHRTITDIDAQRRAVTGAQKAGPSAANDVAPPAAPARPQATMRDVDGFLARNDLGGAMAVARSLAQGGADGPTARAVMAWCSAGGGAIVEPKVLAEGLGALDRVLTGDPECVRALLYRALIAKRLGRADAAMRDFKKVARLEPQNVTAQREVRIHEMRARASGATASSSVTDLMATKVPNAPPLSSRSSPGIPASKRAPEAKNQSSVRSGLRRLLARVAGK